MANEVCLRLLQSDTLAKSPNPRYLFGAIATATYRILVDHARRRKARKRDRDSTRQSLDSVFDTMLDRSLAQFHRDNNLEISDALHKALTKLKRDRPRQHEVLLQRYFGSRTVEETAALFEVAPRTIELDTKHALIWLRCELED